MAARKKKPTVANVRNELTDEQRSGSDKIISQCKEIENRCSEVMKDWKRSLATIHGMLGDFCGLAHAVDPYPLDSNQWTIYFPSGSLSAKKYCESRISVLKEAVARTVGRPIQLRLVVTGNCQAAPDAKPELMKSNSFARGDIKAARPTEYKGVVYRSKSEAMFARYLELSLADWCIDNSNKYRGSAGFHYEPEYLDVDGWRPDFFVFYTCYPTNTCIEARRREGHLYSAPQTSYAIYEYKPSRPTDEYVREFCTRCDTILSKAYGDYFSFGTVCDIYYGSVFNEVRGVIHADDLSGGDDTEDWLAKYEDQIKATRFDLRHSQ